MVAAVLERAVPHRIPHRKTLTVRRESGDRRALRRCCDHRVTLVEELFDYGSGDLWRHTWAGSGRVSIAATSLSPGEYLVEHHLVRPESIETVGQMCGQGGFSKRSGR